MFETVENAPSPAPGEPRCGNCGYPLTGLVDSSKCPECGKPFVEVLTRGGPGTRLGKRYRSKATMFGLPVVDIALGPWHGESYGRARGIIAIGDVATGALALGGMARGGVAIGGMAIGVFSIGGGAFGLLTAVGGFACGTLAAGGGAVGIAASGGGALGVFAQGGGALGLFVRDARTLMNPPAAPTAFRHMAWYFGPPTLSTLALLQPVVVNLGVTVAAAVTVALTTLTRLRGET